MGSRDKDSIYLWHPKGHIQASDGHTVCTCISVTSEVALRNTEMREEGTKKTSGGIFCLAGDCVCRGIGHLWGCGVNGVQKGQKCFFSILT